MRYNSDFHKKFAPFDLDLFDCKINIKLTNIKRCSCTSGIIIFLKEESKLD